MKEFSEVWGCNKVTFWTEGGFFFSVVSSFSTHPMNFSWIGEKKK